MASEGVQRRKYVTAATVVSVKVNIVPAYYFR
ncbi:uncharacterized protein G2W53_004865 [Senna tora]|uniref:Uncharacterized protein n=1 Tax=Senna tora TaxID=362788 RepID=A0A835CKP0_9FABA|nr:uncharacterized protein G2W53_004865 [Senna tora]